MNMNLLWCFLFLVLCPLTQIQTQSANQKQWGAKRYVMAPNGLSLRNENTLKSERLAILPLGSEVEIVSGKANPVFEVEHISGQMVQVNYKGQTGFCFSGYLSELPMPKEEQSSKAYFTFLKESFPEAQFSSKDNDPDFHQGYTVTYTLPTRKWHEAYYIAHALHKLPKGLGYPNPKGPDKEEVEDPDKEDDVWGSALTITRNANQLQSVVYGYRMEGFGYSVVITQEENGFFTVENVNFVD